MRAVAFASTALALIAGCSDATDRAPFDTTDGGASSPSSASGSGGTTPAGGDGGGSARGDGSVGAACALKADCDQALGLDCLTTIPAVPAAGFPGKTFPGGMCTKKCGQPNPDSTNPEDRNLTTDCGPSATCVQSSGSTSQGGSVSLQMCMKTCVGNSDCRTMEGYMCIAGAFGVRTCQAP